MGNTRAWNQDERDYTRSWNESRTAYEDAWNEAMYAAQYGDMSKLQALGISPDLYNLYLAAMAGKGQYVGNYGTTPVTGYYGSSYSGNPGVYSPTPVADLASTGYGNQQVSPAKAAYEAAFARANSLYPEISVITQRTQ